MFIVAGLLTLVFGLWLLIRIWKSSPIIAIVTFFFFPAAIISLVQNWGDEEHDVRWPFFLTLGCWALTVYSAVKLAGELEAEAALSLATRIFV